MLTITVIITVFYIMSRNIMKIYLIVNKPVDHKVTLIMKGTNHPDPLL